MAVMTTSLWLYGLTLWTEHGLESFFLPVDGQLTLQRPAHGLLTT